MNPKPLVSVVAVAYNNWPDVELAVQSALGQSHKPVEVIVIDNSSSDATPAELPRRFGSRVVYRRQPNTGDAGAYNAGALLARGEYLQFLDGDDVLSPYKIEKQMQVFLDHPETDIVHGDIRNFQALPGASRLVDHATRDYPDMVAAVLDPRARCVQSPLGALISRRAFDRVGAWDEAVYCTDFDYFLRAAWSGCRFRHCPGLMGFSRIHPRQMSADPAAMARGTEAVLRKALGYIDREPHRSLVASALARHRLLESLPGPVGRLADWFLS